MACFIAGLYEAPLHVCHMVFSVVRRHVANPLSRIHTPSRWRAQAYRDAESIACLEHMGGVDGRSTVPQSCSLVACETKSYDACRPGLEVAAVLRSATGVDGMDAWLLRGNDNNEESAGTSVVHRPFIEDVITLTAST